MILFHAAPLCLRCLEGRGRTGSQGRVKYLGADDCVRADDDAFAALDAEFLVPHGNFCAMLRFSHWAVPVGKVPSAGRALTGRSSPWPSAIMPSTSRTNAGAPAGTAGRISKLAVTLAREPAPREMSQRPHRLRRSSV